MSQEKLTLAERIKKRIENPDDVVKVEVVTPETLNLEAVENINSSQEVVKKSGSSAGEEGSKDKETIVTEGKKTKLQKKILKILKNEDLDLPATISDVFEMDISEKKAKKIMGLFYKSYRKDCGNEDIKLDGNENVTFEDVYLEVNAMNRAIKTVVESNKLVIPEHLLRNMVAESKLLYYFFNSEEFRV